MIAIWPVPAGHKSKIILEQREVTAKIEVIDLISAGLIAAGQTLYPKQRSAAGQLGQVLDDGRISAEGEIFDSLSLAAIRVVKRRANGWTFWLVDEKTKQSMNDLRKQYRDLIGEEDGEEDGEDEGQDG